MVSTRFKLFKPQKGTLNVPFWETNLKIDNKLETLPNILRIMNQR